MSMGLFRSKTETYVETALTADIERGRYLARILERGDIPLRGLHTVLRWLNERREQINLGLDPELSHIVSNFYAGGITYADLDRVYFSLCLSGPPGTGKSAFERYLAKRLGLEIMQKRASDLLGMFVGHPSGTSPTPSTARARPRPC
jgi:ATPase family associated with various cellular activities (AAA)